MQKPNSIKDQSLQLTKLQKTTHPHR